MERANKHTINAFTILELVVVLTISALVIALGYSSYRLINQLYTNSREKQEKFEKRIAMTYQLQEDFILSRSAVLYNQQLEVRRIEDTVYYGWKENQMFRKVRQVVDTLVYENHQLSFFYEGEETAVGLIDEIRFTIDEEWPLLFQKEYSAMAKMEKQELFDGN